MFDLVLLAMGLGFFALSIGYAYACDGFKGRSSHDH